MKHFFHSDYLNFHLITLRLDQGSNHGLLCLVAQHSYSKINDDFLTFHLFFQVTIPVNVCLAIKPNDRVGFMFSDGGAPVSYLFDFSSGFNWIYFTRFSAGRTPGVGYSAGFDGLPFPWYFAISATIDEGDLCRTAG